MELLNKIRAMKEMYVPFGKATNMPFVICDPETFNDQVWIFAEQKDVRAFAEEYEKKGVPIALIQIPNEQFLRFYSMLYNLGVNEVVVTDEEGVHVSALDKIVTRPDYSSLPKEKVPISNPGLQLSGLYFMQEFRRTKETEPNENMRELEEEMAANLVRGTFIMAIHVEGDAPEKDGSNVQVPFVKNKDGEMFQPIFTDPEEFNKFNREKQFRAIVIPYKDLEKAVLKNSKGIVVNPMGFNLILIKEQLGQLQRRFEQV